jgi:hypothetical protein
MNRYSRLPAAERLCRAIAWKGAFGLPAVLRPEVTFVLEDDLDDGEYGGVEVVVGVVELGAPGEMKV